MKQSILSVREQSRFGFERVKTLLAVGVLGLVMGANVAFAQNVASSQTLKLPMQYHGISPPLRDLARNPPFVSAENGHVFEDELEKLVEITEPVRGPVTPPPQPFVQTAPPKPFAAVLGTSFEATGTGLFGFTITGAPPDMTLAVGPRHIVTWVNSQYAVFDKAGNVLLAPVNGNTLFTGLGNVCETTNRGDPILQYDRLANRWVLSQFAFTSQTAAPWLQCIAVSTTDDPTGTYVRYTVDFGAIGFNDYGKLGVWPDGYYTSYNIFNSPSAFILALCASDRVKMLAGDPTATTLCVASANIAGGAAFLPADLDGTTLPSDLTQGGIFVRQSTAPALRYTKLKPNFTAGTATATDGFGGASGSFVNLALPTTTRACNGAANSTCIAQPGTTNLLDTLGDRLMYRLAFRNRGGVESMIVTHSVDPDGAGARSSALRWYEIRNPLGNPANVVVALRPTLFQNGTYDPGAAGDRWMGSMAMDKYGNMLAGYSVVNSATLLKPSIAVAGRLAGDAINTLQAESIALTGTGSQNGTLTRWGDYSTMQIDPVDDSTFWFISQYLTADGTFNWRTRVVSYRFQVPVATTLPASLVSKVAATLNGTINASGISSVVSFEYGLTNAYGTTVTATPSPVTGAAATAVNFALTGLTANTTYHFRVRAANTEGTDIGVNQSFYTNDLGLQVGSVTLPAITNTFANGVTRVRYSQVFGSVPVVVVQPTNEDADPQAVRILNVTAQGFDLLQVEAPGGAGCASCTGKGLGMTVNWLAALPGSYRLPNIVPEAALRFGVQPSAPGLGVLVKVGTVSTSANQRSALPGGFASWPATSWQPVIYPAHVGINPANFVFGSPPVVLTTIQTWTTANEGTDLNLAGLAPTLTGVPEPWATVVSRAVTATGFDVALESSEVDNDDTGGAGFNGAETIGYIAIQSGVSVQLRQNDGPVVGLGTGVGTATDACTAIDVLFPTGTPLVAANFRGFAGKQTRVDDDGGWLRRCVLSSPAADTARMTVKIDEDDDLDVDRAHASAETFGAAIFGGDFTTTPIALARLSSARSGGSIDVRLSTATEVGHLGYRIWGRTNAQSDWRALHADLIVSANADGMVGRSYQRTVAADQINEIRIEDVDILGRSRFHPETPVGTVIGADAITAPLNWAAIQAANLATPVRLSRGTESAVLADVLKSGIQRVRYEDMAAAGWPAAVSLVDIAVTDRSRAMLRHVACPGKASEFGPGCTVEWLATASESLYGALNAYKIAVDPANARVVSSGALVDLGDQPRVANSEIKFAPNRGYSFSAPGNDPWYDARMVATSSPVEISREFSLPERADGPVNISIMLWGGLDYAGTSSDHSVEILLNGQSLDTRRFDGLVEERIDLSLPTGLLLPINSLTVRVLADTGYVADVVLLDGFTINYPRKSTVSGGELRAGIVNAELASPASDFFGSSFESKTGFKLAGITAPSVIWSQAGETVRRDTLAADGLLDVSTSGFVLSESSHIAVPSLRNVVAANINTTTVDYLIITHPLFEAELTQLIALQQGRGFSVRTLRTDEIYAAKSDFAPSPQAIREVISQINPRFVLLVGGDSYDYNDYLGVGSQSYLPTFYHAADQIVRFAATDALFSDTNDDGTPERALGRIPARTVAELRLAISSIVQRGNTPAVRYLAVAGASSPAEHFDIHSRSLLSYLRQGQPTEFALVDELGITAARAKAAAGLGGDADWVNYLGHSSPNRWASQNLLDTSQLSGINRSGIPAVVSQWGCWNNYFVLPDQDTMAHALMLRSNRLASSVIGSTSLAEDASHMALGTRFFDLVEDGRIGDRDGTVINTLGEALMAAKADLMRSNPENIESNYSITLFGDPAAVLR